MNEIKIPEEIPLSSLEKKIDELIKEEEMKWALFEKCKEGISLTEEYLDELEKIREESWKETKKKYRLWLVPYLMSASLKNNSITTK